MELPALLPGGCIWQVFPCPCCAGRTTCEPGASKDGIAENMLESELVTKSGERCICWVMFRTTCLGNQARQTLLPRRRSVRSEAQLDGRYERVPSSYRPVGGSPTPKVRWLINKHSLPKRWLNSDNLSLFSSFYQFQRNCYTSRQESGSMPLLSS